MIIKIIIGLIKVIIITIVALVCLAFLTLWERKILGSMHLRTGPTAVGWIGVLQPIADAVKLFSKETVLPNHANIGIFLMSPVIGLTLALIGWAVIPFGYGAVLADLNIGILYLFAVSSLGVYAILCSGWASNSRYPFLGALRASAQMISYEVSIGIIILTVVVSAGSLNLTEIVLAQKGMWYGIALYPSFVMFLISSLAETFRAPFDLPESESELVSGYNTEYSALTFGLFFLAEYSHIIMMSYFNAILFLGGWLSPSWILDWIPGVIWLGIKVSFLVFWWVWARGSLPRFRYDNIMNLGWKSYLPLSLGHFVLVLGMLIGCDYIAPLRG